MNPALVGENMENDDEKVKKYANMVIRCPRLGGEVPFSYCEKEAGDLPCRLVVSCWSIYFPIEEYLHERLSPEELERFTNLKPQDRMATILGIAEAVRKRKSA